MNITPPPPINGLPRSLFIENISRSFDWFRAVGEIIVSAWFLPKFGVTFSWNIENQHTKF